MGGPRQRGWAPIGLPSCGKPTQEAERKREQWEAPLPRPTHPTPKPRKETFWAPGSDGWAAATGLGSHCPPIRPPERKHEGVGSPAPLPRPTHGPMKGSDGWAAGNPPTKLKGLGAHCRAHPSDPGAQKGNMKGAQWEPMPTHPTMFPFWAPGSDGWVAATGLGSRWAPFVLWMGGPRQRGWLQPRKERYGAGLPLGSLHVSFLGSRVGWVGRGNGRFPLVDFTDQAYQTWCPEVPASKSMVSQKQSGNSPAFSTEEPCGTGRILACVCEASLRTSCKLYLQTILDCLLRKNSYCCSAAVWQQS